MATDTSHVRRAAIWRLARAQHGVVSADQLARLRLSPAAIRHRARRGSLHRIHPGVYAVGRPELGPRGHWMAAVLASGSGAALSDLSAARFWEIVRRAPGRIHVTLPRGVDRRPAGITIHRRRQVKGDVVERDGIPVTSPIRTLIDLATRLDRRGLERAVNEADRIDLVSPEDLRSAIAGRRERGVGVLRGLLDRRTFRLTDSELERRFLGLVRRAQLPLPDTGSVVNGFKVDFHWPELGLVVETDGLRYHRTPGQQARDRLRDQAHACAGITCLRFTHAQVRYERARVVGTLDEVARRLSRRSGT